MACLRLKFIAWKTLMFTQLYQEVKIIPGTPVFPADKFHNFGDERLRFVNE
jgi:hypothetical protein